MKQKYDYMFKFVLIGDSEVGKTCILTNYIEQYYQPICSVTIGVDFQYKIIKTDENKFVKLQIWDTAGQERFRSLSKFFYRNADGIVIMYDITKKESFNSVKETKI